MYDFDEQLLIGELGAIAACERVAFATAAATRQLVNFERYAENRLPASVNRPREIANQLWSAIKNLPTRKTNWSALLDEVMELLPEERVNSTIADALADDAVSSLAYAIRCQLSSDSMEAIWAARRAYEAADQVAIRMTDIEMGLPNAEVAIRSHKIVQRELARQRADLLALQNHRYDEVEQTAFLHELLTQEEASVLDLMH